MLNCSVPFIKLYYNNVSCNGDLTTVSDFSQSGNYAVCNSPFGLDQFNSLTCPPDQLTNITDLNQASNNQFLFEAESTTVGFAGILADVVSLSTGQASTFVNTDNSTNEVEEMNDNNSQEFVIDPINYAPTFIAFFSMVALSYFAGMSFRTILRFLR